MKKNKAFLLVCFLAIFGGATSLITGFFYLSYWGKVEGDNVRIGGLLLVIWGCWGLWQEWKQKK